MVKRLKEQLPALLITAIITMASGFSLARMTSRADKVDNAASTEYVDTEVNKVATDSYNRDKALDRKIDTKADKDDMDEVIKTIQTMDSRIYDLWKEKYK